MRNSLLLTFLLWSLPALAAEPTTASTNQTPMIDIKARSATYQFDKGTVVFSGGVTVHDPDALMTCQKLVATFAKQKKTNDTTKAASTVRLTSGEQIDKIEAIGNVAITVLTKEHKGTTGRCERAVYTASNRKIIMLGNRPTIKKPKGERTTANTIIYFIETGVVDAEGDVEFKMERPKSLYNTSTRPPAR